MIIINAAFVIQAVELDDGDVTLWFKIGCVATKVLEYELASEAFQEVKFYLSLLFPFKLYSTQATISILAKHFFKLE